MKRRNSSTRTKWPKPVCCKGSAFIAGSGSSIRSSTASRRKPTTSVEWSVLPVSSWRPAGACPTPAHSRQDLQSRVTLGGCCWWVVQVAGKPQCAQSCCGPHLHRGHTVACTSRAWRTTSAGQMTQTRYVSAASSKAWWRRSAAAGWCQDMRRRYATRLCRRLCSPGNVRGTLQRPLNGKDAHKAQTFTFISLVHT